VIMMYKQLIALGIIGILVTIGISGCLEEKTSSVTFTVYGRYNGESYNITIYDVSIPLDESEAFIVFETVSGEKWNAHEEDPSYFKQITKTDDGWSILYGTVIAETGYVINEQNRTINIYAGY